MERLGRTSSRGRAASTPAMLRLRTPDRAAVEHARTGFVTEWWQRAEHQPIGYDMLLAGLGSFLGASVCLACATVLLFLQPV